MVKALGLHAAVRIRPARETGTAHAANAHLGQLFLVFQIVQYRFGARFQISARFQGPAQAAAHRGAHGMPDVCPHIVTALRPGDASVIAHARLRPVQMRGADHHQVGDERLQQVQAAFDKGMD